MAAGAWIAELAVRYARNEVHPLPENWRELIGDFLRVRVDVQRAGNVVNQVARHANATGQFEPDADRLLGLVERLLRRVDEATAQAFEESKYRRR